MASLPSRLVPPLASRVAFWTDEVELHLLDVLADKSRSSVDIGANIGIYSYLLSHRSSHVFAVEPHPTLAAFLRTALPPTTTVLEMALSDRSGLAELHIPLLGRVDFDTRSSLERDANPGFATRSVPVQVCTLDALDWRNVGFLKIDVEGHGLPVLRGGSRLLQREQPRVLVEVEDRTGPGSMSEIIQSMRSLDYEGCQVLGRDVLPVGAAAGAKDHASAEVHACRGGQPPPVRNLIFLPRHEWATLVPRLRQRVRAVGLLNKLASLVRA